MILADSNFWLALALSKHAFHPAVRDWLAHLPSGESVLFCRATQQSLLRLLTTRAVFGPYGIPPLSNTRAWAMYEGFRADSRIGWAKEPGGLDARWKTLAGHPRASPKLWMDAYLAGFALAGGYRLVTTDKAFKQFKKLDLIVLPNA